MHVANVLSGGHSGRPHTFIVGLDDSRFPGSRLQDPILLDEERRGLSKELRTSSSDLARRIELVARLFARLRGTVTLSYSCFNLMDDREMFPSSIVLSAFRILSGQREGDQAALNQWLGPAASFAPNAIEKALTESEWWLWRMSEKAEVVDPSSLVAARYPHLGRGFELAQMRRSDEFTVFDGRLPIPGPELDLTSSAGPTVSASRLETLGQCPLKYFFRYVLDLEPPAELAIDPSVWLDPLARGSLLHEVFELFLKELINAQALPDALRDEPRLMAILEERIGHYRNEIPPPSEAVFRREQARLRRTARIFLREEAEYCRETGNRPLYLEVAIGLKATASGTKLDTDLPVPVKLPDGSSLRARGRIDRVDQVAGRGPNVFAIWDYKSGGTWKYTQEPRPFWAGRVVQHALYMFVMNARLADMAKEYPGARVERFGYFFPSEKASGERIEYTAEQLEDGRKVLARLARIAAAGAFLATTTADKDCGYCDYRGICGDVEAVAAASAGSLSSPRTRSWHLTPSYEPMVKRSREPAAAKTASSAQPQDQAARDLIVNELDKNVLVEAAAGTGKTTSLVARMINLIRQDKCPVENLAAVTFTRKAASELRSRFQVGLEKAAGEASGIEKDRLAAAVEHVERTFLGTIHSFCARLLRERPVEAGVDLEFSELDEAQDSELRAQAWSEHVARMVATSNPLVAELDHLGH